MLQRGIVTRPAVRAGNFRLKRLETTILRVIRMVGFDLGTIVLGALAAVFAGVSKGGFGSGAAFASVSVLALVLSPAQALGIMLPLLMLALLSVVSVFDWR